MAIFGSRKRGLSSYERKRVLRELQEEGLTKRERQVVDEALDAGQARKKSYVDAAEIEKGFQHLRENSKELGFPRRKLGTVKRVLGKKL